MEEVLADVRFALRTFRRLPGPMTFALVSLALGIGASTAMFSVTDSVLLRPLPFPDPDRLVSIYPGNPRMAGHPTLSGAAERGTFSLPEFHWIAENQDAFDHVGAYFSYGGPSLTGDGAPRRLDWIRATPGVLPALAVEPVLGRAFGEEDDPARGGRSVMLTESFWSTRFGRDPDVVGQTLRLDDASHVIIGVLPDRVADATWPAQIWTLMTGSSDQGNWGNHNVSGVLGRLRDGVSIAQADAQVEALLAGVGPDRSHDHLGSVFPRLEDQTRHVRPGLLALVAAAFVLLVVGCCNVGAILLGVGIDRQREMALRGAVGADRGRLTRQLLTEGMVLATSGAVLGVLIAFLLAKGLVILAPDGVPRVDEAAVDGRALLLATAVAAAAGLVFGLFPALGLRWSNLSSSLTSARGDMGGRNRFQSAVVAGELALATVLLISSALLGRTLLALDRVDLGFDAEGLYAVDLAIPFHRFTATEDEDGSEAGSRDPEAALDAYVQEVVDGVAALPGVSSVAVTSIVPLGGSQSNNDVHPEGWDPEAHGGEVLVAERRFVSGNYFETVGIPIVEGRGFTEADNGPDAQPAVIVSRGLAERAWPGESAAGKHLAFWGRDPALVVGVAGSVRDQNLDQETAHAYYVPARQVGAQVGSLMIRIQGDPEGVVPTVRSRILDIDAELPITRLVSMDALRRAEAGAQRYRARLMVAFGVLAAAFALLGVYAVSARAVARRTREIGVRSALGAAQGDVLRMVLGQGLRLAIWGVAVGVGISAVVSRSLEGLLFGVEGLDPGSFLAVSAFVAACAVLACVPPGRRAARVDPSTALRAE